MIKTNGKIITKEETYILKGVEAKGNIILGGNGFCFDIREKIIYDVETMDNEMYIKVEKQFFDKNEYIYERS